MATPKSKTFKQLACKICGEIVEKVDINADKVTCSRCVSKSLQGIINKCDEEPLKDQ
jgi:formylmethanofuran dehydrogenase subunit E